MRIEELFSGQSLTLLITANGQQLQFESEVQDILPRKHMIVIAPVLKDGKVIAFNGKGIHVHVIASFPDQKPQIFYNVIISTAKKEDDSYCYYVTTVAAGKEYNRRGAFRCFVGINTSVQVGLNHSTADVIIKDISTTGFSFTPIETEKEYQINDCVHAVINDYIEDTAKNYTFRLFGSIVRSENLENGKTVYGCKLINSVSGIDKYIMEKERIRMRNQRQAAR